MKLLFFLSVLSVAFARDLPLRRANGLAPSVSSTVINPNPATGGTYPRMTQLTYTDNSLLASVTAFSAGSTMNILTVTRSTDNGQTFSSLGTIASGTGDIDNAYLHQLPNGSVLAVFRNHDWNRTTKVYSYYRITACISTDGGATWSFLAQINERAATATNNGLWEPFIRIAASGAIQVYYASENSASDQDILMQSSTNNGATWSSPITVAGATTTGRDGMPGCADYTPSGGVASVICIFETTETTAPLFTVKAVVSTTDGTSFAPTRYQVYIPTGSGKNAGAPQVVKTTNNILVASFMTDEDNTATHKWPQGASVKLLTSKDTTPAAWGQKTTLLPISSLWAGIFARTDGSGTVIGCADNGGATCRSVSFS
ncbi:Sialidase domain-containing protein [Mycena chlorophos]|uniref:Sialidase domain-containing protein n=1 Tax=Mycena chlorophos TaxID=658473 RepID=A0A8H6TL58_MYCCL|nr:Sialidase domain-containing protein [Mycena chlorophos]